MHEKMPELKLCPFCGGKAHYWYSDYESGSDCFVECTNGNCCAQVIGEIDEKEAAKAWNRRVLKSNPTLEHAGEMRELLVSTLNYLEHTLRGDKVCVDVVALLAKIAAEEEAGEEDEEIS